MVDIDSRTIVDMIESRETEDVALWLSEYPNINIVSRDGSQSYAAAITQAHPGAMQVSDRFHIMKNINEKATLALQKIVQGRLAIPMTCETQQYQTLMLIGTISDRVQLVRKLRKEGRSLNEIHMITGASEHSVKKYAKMKDSEVPQDKPTVREREHNEAVKKLQERAYEVRALHNEGLSINAITKKTGFTRNTVRNYLSEGFIPVNAHYGKQREGKLEPFRDEVFKLKAKGFTYRQIHESIMGRGYTGTQDAIRGFISKERRIQRDLQTSTEQPSHIQELIDKKWIIQLLYKPIERVKGITESQLNAVFEVYPLVKDILRIVNGFKTIIKSKDSKNLSSWMQEAVSLNLDEVNTFVNGLNQDLEAVSNAINFDYSNGLAEGIVNKIKLIKRTMYGRCKFPLLKNKCLILNDY